MRIIASSKNTRFTHIPETTRFFGSIGLPYWVVWFIAIVELIAAVTFLLGVLSEWGYVIAVETAVIILKLQFPKSFTHSNLELMIFGAALLMALAGPGKYSILPLISTRKTRAALGSDLDRLGGDAAVGVRRTIHDHLLAAG